MSMVTVEGSKIPLLKYEDFFTKELLEKEYVKNELSSIKIGRKYGVNKTIILTLLRKYNIQARKKSLNLVGKKFGHLTVIQRHSEDGKSAKWLCECDCKDKKLIIFTGSGLRKSSHPSCGCAKKQYIPHKKYVRDGKYLPYGLWSDIRRGAISRNVFFNITFEYIETLLEQQNFRCELSDILFIFPKNSTEVSAGFRNLSLDRIDSSKGYIEGNVRWVHKWINIMKSDLSDSEFLYLCHEIAKNTKIDLSTEDIRLIEHTFDINTKDAYIKDIGHKNWELFKQKKNRLSK